MTIPKVVSDAEITEEALKVLLENMPPSKVARFLAACKIGKGDYLKTRDELFANDTFESLLAEMNEMARQKPEDHS